jgi:excisionase family DNA binding protein
MLNLMSLDEAAKELKLSVHTLRAWRQQRRFPVVKLGRRVLVRLEDLERMVKKNLIGAEEE